MRIFLGEQFPLNERDSSRVFHVHKKNRSMSGCLAFVTLFRSSHLSSREASFEQRSFLLFFFCWIAIPIQYPSKDSTNPSNHCTEEPRASLGRI